jgi:hypothetical protein
MVLVPAHLTVHSMKLRNLLRALMRISPRATTTVPMTVRMTMSFRQPAQPQASSSRVRATWMNSARQLVERLAYASQTH